MSTCPEATPEVPKPTTRSKKAKKAEGFKLQETDKGLKLILSDPGLKSSLYHAGCTYSVTWGMVAREGNATSYLDLEDLYEEVKGNDLFEIEHEDEDFNKFIKWLSLQGEAIEAKIQAKLKEGLASFAGLKSVFKKGDIVVFSTPSGDQAMRVDNVTDYRSWFGVFKKIVGKCLSHNGRGFISGPMVYQIPLFSGYKPVTDLGIRPLTDDDRTALLARGEKFVRLTSQPSYMGYTGNLVRRGWMFDQVYNSNGRVMIDLGGMKQADPDYDKYLGCPGQYDDDESEPLKPSEISDDQKILSVPCVYGFSFRSKKWGEMEINSISEIRFREDAYNNLVIPQETKDLLLSLVDSSFEQGKDFVDGKGGGLIFLLHGVPGVGKTFTAEAISEKLRRPLYMVSVGELGTNAVDVEKNLKEILETATRWNAILLIDECDIFLEARKEDDMHRNAVVSVFLRMVEYYQGILFLTTNRVKDLDTAFYSRISLPIKYDALGSDARRSIWINHLMTNGVGRDKAEDFANRVHQDFSNNGRQIKNVVRIALSLATRENRELEIDDLIKVLQYLVKFDLSK